MDVERFNKFHGAAGSGHGGQFVSSADSGGSVSRATGDSGIPGHFPHQLAHWWEHGEGAAKIRWGAPGDFDRCVRLAVEEAHMDSERAKGFCAVRHHAVLGIYPATHAAEERKAVGRSVVTEPAQYDADGLDASWDGDLDDLPDLTGLDVADFEALDPSPEGMSRAAKLGTGARFGALKAKLAAKGAHNPGALAAYIGRKKYGRKKFGALAGHARGGGGGMRRMAGDWREIIRPFVVEDLHIMRAAEGDSSGRVVEGYAAVFGQPQTIRDPQGPEGYTEEIDPHAFDAALNRMSQRRGGIGSAVRVLFNHGKTIEGHPAPEFQKPIGRAVSITPDSRGLLTRTEFNRTALADEVLELIRSGSITGMSFQGNDLRSDPPLRGPGDRYRRGAKVRRMALSLFEYSPVVFEAYPGAEFLGVVRMGSYDTYEDVTATDGGLTGYEPDLPGMEEEVDGGTPEEVRPTRDHAHRLLVTRMEEMCQRSGLVLPGRG